jgi:hypothetical protein
MCHKVGQALSPANPVIAAIFSHLLTLAALVPFRSRR